MASYSGFRIPLLAGDYPSRYDGLVTAAENVANEVEAARGGFASLQAGLVGYAGATANIPLAGYRITGAASSGYASNELIPKSYADAVSAAAAAPRAMRAGDVYTGTHDFSGATINVATALPGASGSGAASIDFVNALAFASSMPALAGSSLKYARVNAAETSIEYAEVYAYGGRSARASNAILASGDIGKLIDITAGTFTQTFTAAATLGSNWFCHIRNSGPGEITLDPAGSELIDGLTSYIMYPGETRLVTCDGTGFHTIVLKSFYKVFTATGTFVKPPGYEMFSGIKWGGGGGGASGYGGGGGGCSQFDFPASVIGASQSVTIGGGAAAGAKGGDTTFIFTTQGGGRGNVYSEGGSAYGTSVSTAPLPNDAVSVAANYAVPVYGFYGGAADVAGNPALRHSVYGGAAGGASAAGTSIFGGAGGVGAGDGTAPGGGGGSTGAGARGELRIWGVL